MSHQDDNAPEVTNHQYIASQHGGLEMNPMTDGGHAPEVVPNSYFAPGQEKIVDDQYKQQYPGQWGQESIPPQYPGTPGNGYGAYGYPPPVQHDAHGAYSPVTAAGTPAGGEAPPRTMFGVARKRALIILALGIVAVLAIAVGVGVGVGVGVRKSSSDSSATATTSSTPTTSGTPTNTEVGCPDANGYSYTTKTSKLFTRYCGIDFGDQNSESKNINSIKTVSMTDCIEQCASYSGCTGCGWGYLTGDTGSYHNCYMKTNLTQSHTAVPGWNFAVLEPSNLTLSNLSGGGTGPS